MTGSQRCAEVVSDYPNHPRRAALSRPPCDKLSDSAIASTTCSASNPHPSLSLGRATGCTLAEVSIFGYDTRIV